MQASRISARAATLAVALWLAPLSAAAVVGAGVGLPNDPSLRSLSWPTKQLALPAAWAITAGDPAIRIAVIDSGVTDVADLGGALLPGIDLVNGDDDAHDDNGHGTAVASIIAARTNNGIGIAGVCGRCSILPVKVLNRDAGGSSATVAEGVRWAVAHGASVINISLSSPTDKPVLDASLEDAIAHGVVVVIAAGNGGSADPAHDGYPAAAVSDAIRVAAATSGRRLASWSNHGAWVDTAAPGWASGLGPDGRIVNGLHGTSFSAAYVSGLAGLLLSQNTALTPADVKSLILTAGTTIGAVDVAGGRIADAASALAGVSLVAAVSALPE